MKKPKQKSFKTPALAALVLTITLGAAAAHSPSPTGVQAYGAPGGVASVELSPDDDISGEITISCYEDLGMMGMYPIMADQAKLFEAKYPDTKINIVNHAPQALTQTMEGLDSAAIVVTQVGGAQEIQDYIAQVNVELMSGTGADIYNLDVLPFYKYSASGDFEDLSGYMAADPEFVLSDYRTSIFDALTFDGAQRVMPINFSFSYVVYDATLFNEEERTKLDQMGAASYEELVEFGADAFARANEASDEAVYMFDAIGAEYLLFDENCSTFLDVMDKRANFDDGQFAQLLQTAASYVDLGYLPPSYDQRGGERVMYKVLGSNALFRLFSDDPERQARMVGQISEKIDTDDKLIGMLENAKGEAAFDFNQGFAMNANSKNKRLAWEYIKYLTSYETQSASTFMTMSLNKPAHAEQTRRALAGQLGQDTDSKGSLSDQAQRELDAYMEAVDELAGRINTYVVKDSIVTQMINDELFQYTFGRSESAEETASAIQNKLFLYLNE
jgi:multiple sugar transport system substrate-binding protein